MEERPKAKVIADDRERVLIGELGRLPDCDLKVERLPLGDFICSDRAVVERKTRDDFEASIIDGRLFSQLQDLAASFQRVILVVEGQSDSERISRNALLGAYASAMVDYGASILFTRGPESTAEAVVAIARHEQLANRREARIFAKRKALTNSQFQRAVLESFPMIGPKVAKELLNRFGTIENVMLASMKELSEVDGMGPKRAAMLREILDCSYDPGQD
ncbi:MAG: ERCC4 domain-containing protein [Candidatus Bilamarchaeaceae archaeon]